jgi:hypothetical protein
MPIEASFSVVVLAMRGQWLPDRLRNEWTHLLGICEWCPVGGRFLASPFLSLSKGFCVNLLPVLYGFLSLNISLEITISTSYQLLRRPTVYFIHPLVIASVLSIIWVPHPTTQLPFGRVNTCIQLPSSERYDGILHIVTGWLP